MTPQYLLIASFAHLTPGVSKPRWHHVRAKLRDELVSPMTEQKEKKCPDCKTVKTVDSFVLTSGQISPLGRRCLACHEKRKLDKLRLQNIFKLDGRSFCIYCGFDIASLGYDELMQLAIHDDHMDPRALGGWDHPDNMLGCCKTCNLRKGDKLFSQWLEELEEPYASLARREYIKKHCYQPEDFVPILDRNRRMHLGMDGAKRRTVIEWHSTYYMPGDIDDEEWWSKEREWMMCNLKA